MSENFEIDGKVVDFKKRSFPGNPDTLIVKDKEGNTYNLDCTANPKEDGVVFGYGDYTKKVKFGASADIRVHKEERGNKTMLILRAINLLEE